jgi:hypothetical protein
VFGRSFGTAARAAYEQIGQADDTGTVNLHDSTGIHQRGRESGMAGDVAAVVRGVIRRLIPGAGSGIAVDLGGFIGRSLLLRRTLLIVRMMGRRLGIGRTSGTPIVAPFMRGGRAHSDDESHHREEQNSHEEVEGIYRSHGAQNVRRLRSCQSYRRLAHRRLDRHLTPAGYRRTCPSTTPIVENFQ